MTLEVLLYRLYRLRRLITVAIAIPLLTVLGIGALNNASYPLLMALAIAVPLAHAMRYPQAWSETMNVSAVLAACLGLATMIDPNIGLGGIIGRSLALVVLWALLYIILVSPFALLASIGPMVDCSVKTDRVSKLDPDALRHSITIFPGRSDDRTICGEADENGVFEVLTKHEFDMVDLTNYEPLPGEDDFDPAPDFNPEELSEVRYNAIVQSSGSDHHEVICFTSDSTEVTATRYDFEPLPNGGTRVTMEERGAQMPLMMRLGFWIQDFIADHLTDEIDRAEGRSPRANRAHMHTQLVVDIARMMTPSVPG